MDAKQELGKYQKKIEPELRKVFKTYKAEAKKVTPESLAAVEHLEEYTMRRAKRLRAALFYYSYKMLGGKDVTEAFKTSVFMELVQSYLLIHDDVMDQDQLRRGKPTMHKIYEDIHRKDYGIQDPKHFGESMAINIGDIACHIAFDILTKSKFPDKNKIRALERAHRQVRITGFGQMLDILTTVKNTVYPEDVYQVHEYKTATYTYETPISVGAILAGATDKDIRILSKYAIPAGIAFQIQDDILGMFGDEDKLGKPNISDLREGKQTLLIVKAQEWADRKDLKYISQALGNPNVTDEQADQVRRVIRECGSLEYSKQIAVKYVKQAKRALARMKHWNGEGRAFLDGIADYMINREF